MAAETLIASALWRRLDTIGTDTARLFQMKSGYRLVGTAVFVQPATGAPSLLHYEVELGLDWATARGVISGFVGKRSVELVIARDSSGWTMNGECVRAEGLETVVDLDLGFTPATNVAQVHRIHLGIGETADFSVAWWEVGESSLVELPQHYERRDEWTYRYESPSVPYAAELEFAPGGFVRSYPRLWVLESG